MKQNSTSLGLGIKVLFAGIASTKRLGSVRMLKPVLGILTILTGVVCVLVFLVRHEPEFYRQLDIPAGEERKQRSGECGSHFLGLLAGIREKGQPVGESFTTEQINSYLREDFAISGAVLPKKMSEPRVAFEENKFRLGFRYGKPPWSTIISIDMRVWLAPPNMVGMELQGMRAGSLPITVQSLLDEVAEAARRRNIEVNWYRHRGNPVAMLKFQADRQTPTVQLRQVELKPGLLNIIGCSIDPVMPRAASQ